MRRTSAKIISHQVNPGRHELGLALQLEDGQEINVLLDAEALQELREIVVEVGSLARDRDPRRQR